MAQKIKIQNNPYFEQEISLSNVSYNLLFKFNTSDQSWYITVRTPVKDIITSGLKVMPNQNLTLTRQYLGIMAGGNLWCVKIKNSPDTLGRDNFGIGKTYELWWIPTSEEEELTINGIIQL